MKIMLSSPDEMLLTKSAAWVKAFVDNNCKYKGLMCIGPADAPIYKIKDVYSKIIYVKQKTGKFLIVYMKSLMLILLEIRLLRILMYNTILMEIARRNKYMAIRNIRTLEMIY